MQKFKVIIFGDTKLQWLQQQHVSAAHSCPAILHVAVERQSVVQENGKKWLQLLFCIVRSLVQVIGLKSSCCD
jgi:hypothetical protein